MKEVQPKLKMPYDKTAIGHFINFMEAGGKVIVKIPDISDLKKEISAKRPFMALLTNNFMNSKKPSLNLHFNIVTGFDNNNIFANDPLWDYRGGCNKYDTSEFFYGVYASAYPALDNASFMLVKKKR